MRRIPATKTTPQPRIAAPLPAATYSSPEDFVALQQQLQRDRRCDYAILFVRKDPASPPGQRPRYLVEDVIPVKLSHQVFMQMSFGILKDRLSGRGARPSAGASKEQDAIALFLFLKRYASQFARAKQQALGMPPDSPLFPNLNQQLRFQVLLEHGIDVQKVMADSAGAEAAQASYWVQNMLPDEVSEEEFMQQMSKPSGMAQECCIC